MLSRYYHEELNEAERDLVPNHLISSEFLNVESDEDDVVSDNSVEESVNNNNNDEEEESSEEETYQQRRMNRATIVEQLNSGQLVPFELQVDYYDPVSKVVLADHAAKVVVITKVAPLLKQSTGVRENVRTLLQALVDSQ